MPTAPLQNMAFKGIRKKLTVMILNNECYYLKTMVLFLVIILKVALLFKK